jgi:hypothetical protein
MPPYNTSSFSNILDAPDRAAQRKAVVTPFKDNFDGSIDNVMQHIGDFTHRCHETGMIEEFTFVDEENPPPDDVDMMTKSNVLHGYPIQDVIHMETYWSIPLLPPSRSFNKQEISTSPSFCSKPVAQILPRCLSPPKI